MTPPAVLGTWVMLSLTPLMVQMDLSRTSLVLLHLILGILILINIHAVFLILFS